MESYQFDRIVGHLAAINENLCFLIKLEQERVQREQQLSKPRGIPIPKRPKVPGVYQEPVPDDEIVQDKPPEED